MAGLDLLDRRIMHELDLDARISASRLARKVRKSKETVNFRLRRLLREGYLKGFYTVFNTSLLGWFYVKHYIKFKDTTPKKEAEIFDYLRMQPNVSYLASVEGRYDCLLLVIVPQMARADSFLSAFMEKYGGFVQAKDMTVLLSTHRLNAKFLFAGKESRDWHYEYELGGYSPDAMERRLLAELSSNARIPLLELAKKCGISPTAAAYRLRKLEQGKVILAYVSEPNFSKLGLRFAQVNITLRDPAIRKRMIAYFDATNRCLFAIEMMGKYDILAEVHVQSGHELQGIIDGFREKFVGKYVDYDICTITREYLVVWGPFAEGD
ncbi:MAG: Lrp/AsnC family transcriptional regulator [Candidatus Micrarchaeia archaeon]|jgi:Lrp/AsnC family leucine-responsive transcriptional regulator